MTFERHLIIFHSIESIDLISSIFCRQSVSLVRWLELNRSVKQSLPRGTSRVAPCTTEWWIISATIIVIMMIGTIIGMTVTVPTWGTQGTSRVVPCTTEWWWIIPTVISATVIVVGKRWHNSLLKMISRDHPNRHQCHNHCRHVDRDHHRRHHSLAQNDGNSHSIKFF